MMWAAKAKSEGAQEVLKTAADATQHLTNAGKMTLTGATISTGSGVWAWLGNNHEEITALAAIIGATMAIAGFLVTLFKHPKK